MRCVYLCAVFGDRDPSVTAEEHALTVVTKHLNAIQASKETRVAECVFVVNTEDERLVGVTRELEPNNPHPAWIERIQIVFRRNHGYSYGAWKAVIDLEEIQRDFDVAFLIEDDYVPSTPQFLDIFLTKMTPRTGFVAQVAEHVACMAPHHAAVSNGLLSLAAIRHCKATCGTTLVIYPHHLDRSGYLVGTENQITFLAGVESCGFTVDDIADVASVPFFDTSTNSVYERGKADAVAPLSPWQFDQ